MAYPNLDDVKGFINSVGFPIVVCLILFWFNGSMMAEQNKILLELTKEITNLESANSENNKLLAMLVTEYRKECKP